MNSIKLNSTLRSYNFVSMFSLLSQKPCRFGGAYGPRRLIYRAYYQLNAKFCRVLNSGGYLLLFFYLFISSLVHAQFNTSANNEIKPLLVGAGMPDDFWTRKHLFYVDGKKVAKTLEEYKGKLIIVDFWATWCGQCWEQIPKNEKLVASYDGAVAILLVDPKSSKDTFEKIAGSHNKYIGGEGARLLETIYEDEYFSSLFPVRGYPAYMWITPAGKFVAGTTRHSVTKGHIDSLLDAFKLVK